LILADQNKKKVPGMIEPMKNNPIKKIVPLLRVYLWWAVYTRRQQSMFGPVLQVHS